jgi:hypothetical protein
LRERSVGVVVIARLLLAKEHVDGLVSSRELVPNLLFIHVIENHSELLNTFISFDLPANSYRG